jgi:hypothetical protein
MQREIIQWGQEAAVRHIRQCVCTYAGGLTQVDFGKERHDKIEQDRTRCDKIELEKAGRGMTGQDRTGQDRTGVGMV